MAKLRLIFGTSKMHHHVFEKKRLALLSEVNTAGVDTFDTALTYGHGCAVETLRKFRKRHNYIKINSKIGLENVRKRSNYFLEQLIRRKLFANQNKDYRIDTLKGLQRQLEENLTIMGCENLNGCYVHEPLLDASFIEELEEFRFNNCDKFRFLGIAAPSFQITDWKRILMRKKFPIQTSLYDYNGEWLEPEKLINEGDTSYGLFSVNSKLNTRSKIKRVAKSQRSLVVTTTQLKNFKELSEYAQL